MRTYSWIMVKSKGALAESREVEGPLGVGDDVGRDDGSWVELRFRRPLFFQPKGTLAVALVALWKLADLLWPNDLRAEMCAVPVAVLLVAIATWLHQGRFSHRFRRHDLLRLPTAVAIVASVFGFNAGVTHFDPSQPFRQLVLGTTLAFYVVAQIIWWLFPKVRKELVLPGGSSK